MKTKGQAVLLILLVVAVALGLGLSIISQSTTDVRITQQEQESARAFNAAEAGIEDALKQINTVALNTPLSLNVDDIPVAYTVSGINFLEAKFNENESAQVILEGTNNTLTLNWVDSNNSEENPGNCSDVSAASGQTAASLLISVINSNFEVRRLGINACSLNSSNNLTDVATAGTDQYLRSYNLNVLATDKLVRIRPLYNTTSLRVTASTPLPNQAYLVDSSAQTETQETKAIQVTRLEPATPSVFDYVLFSGSDLVK
ncbi:MAG: hypothetical protein U1C50_02015 [Patescibacteria group bacterium]|nr:hypothetical protein [Patescibacteria group bacterium]